MDIKTRRWVFAVLTIVGFFLISSGCHKSCVPNDYNFHIDSTIVRPASDSITLGDTIFFESTTSTSMKNESDGKLIDYSGAENTGSTLGVGELQGLNQIGDAVNSFSYIPIKGRIYTDGSLSPNRVKQIIFTENDGRYELSFAIIAQKKGVYTLSISDMPDVVRKCDRSAISMTFSTSVDNHLHYLKEIYYGGAEISPLDSTHTYSFKVY